MYWPVGSLDHLLPGSTPEVCPSSGRVAERLRTARLAPVRRRGGFTSTADRALVLDYSPKDLPRSNPCYREWLRIYSYFPVPAPYILWLCEWEGDIMLQRSKASRRRLRNQEYRERETLACRRTGSLPDRRPAPLRCKPLIFLSLSRRNRTLTGEPGRAFARETVPERSEGVARAPPLGLRVGAFSSVGSITRRYIRDTRYRRTN